MKGEVKPRKTPEEEELSKKLTELRELGTALAQSELDLATLKAELRVFEAKYIRIVGVRYAELDSIEAEIARFQASIWPDDISAQEFAKRSQQQAQESAQAAGKVGEQAQEKKFVASDDLKSLYREVAKKIHPDLATDEKERIRRERLMAEANRAYEEGDEERLKAILREWDSRESSVKGEDIGAKLVRTIRKIAQIKERLRLIDSEINNLKKSELYQLKLKVEEADKDGKDLLSEMVSRLDFQISAARQKLNKLMATERSSDE